MIPDGSWAHEDQWFDTKDEPKHDDLCAREQLYLHKAITENVDLSQHITDAINSLKIVLAADESARTGKTIEL